jgi:1,4-dihydroxy-2-naphthoate octaprenyltransferase
MENTIELRWSSRRWEVLQPPIYLISILPGLAWAVLLPSSASRTLLALTTLAVVLIQHGVNVLNDAIDWNKGADSEKELSWVHFHRLDLKTVKTHGLLSFVTGVVVGVAIVSHYQVFELLWVALPLVLLGYSYNSSQWTLSYTFLGEWVTGLCYGPGVFGCMGYLFLKNISMPLLLGSVAFGFLAVAVLFSHQPPQILSDFLAGKSSFAVRHGPQKTFLVAQIFTVIFSLTLTLIFCFNFTRNSQLLVLVLTTSVSLYRFLRTPPSPKSVLNAALILIGAAIALQWGDKLL